MKYFTTAHFDREFRELTPLIRKAFQKQIQLLLGNLLHPSLHAKKYDEASGVWQARVTKNIRLYFSIEGDNYRLLNIRRHKD